MRRSLRDRRMSAEIFATFRPLMENIAAHAEMTIVDMPIGLAEEGRRACERLARSLLKPKRNSSVFPTPARHMLSFETYEEANAWGKSQGPGRGLPKQTWNIMPKIREIDDFIKPDDQVHLGEGHPEVAFWRLNGGAPCEYPKRTSAGKDERLALLKRAGITDADALYENLRAEYGSAIAEDDVYDACALALTAEARLIGMAQHLTDGKRDARGLLMEIWG